MNVHVRVLQNHIENFGKYMLLEKHAKSRTNAIKIIANNQASMIRL